VSEAPELLLLEFDNVESLRAQFKEHLSRGGCFVPGETDLCTSAPCVLVLIHPLGADSLSLPATAVWVSPEPPGVGVQLNDFSDVLRQEITAFIDAPAPADDTPADDTPADDTPAPEAQSLQARLRGLSAAEQLKMARSSTDATARATLERIYGKHVWPALLSNPRLTVPEVTRMARMGNLPIPLLEQIADNRAWLSSPQVRRILLTNPRVTRTMVRKILAVTPKAELKSTCKQTAYPAQVREAARKLLER
jgi:Tfp pilus assembly protein PilZ